MGATPTLDRAPNPQTQSPLLALPPELRVEIYKLLFSSPADGIGRVKFSLHDGHGNSRQSPSVLFILQVCRLIKEEAEGLYFNSMYTWDGYSVDHIENFFRISPRRLSALRTFQVYIDQHKQMTQIIRLSSKMPTLRALYISANHVQQRDKTLERELEVLGTALKLLPVTLVNLTYVRPEPQYTPLGDPHPDLKYFEQVEALFKEVIVAKRKQNGYKMPEPKVRPGPFRGRKWYSDDD